MLPPEWLQLLSVASNLTVIIVGIKVIRQFSRIELKVEMMWTVFMRRFGNRTSENEQSES